MRRPNGDEVLTAVTVLLMATLVIVELLVRG